MKWIRLIIKKKHRIRAKSYLFSNVSAFSTIAQVCCFLQLVTANISKLVKKVKQVVPNFHLLSGDRGKPHVRSY